MRPRTDKARQPARVGRSALPATRVGIGLGRRVESAAALAAAPAPTVEQAMMTMAQTGQEAQPAQPAVAEPRIAAPAATPHKRQAVAAGMTVEAGEEGG
eukprot:271421-Prymnesium_polylepis.1